MKIKLFSSAQAPTPTTGYKIIILRKSDNMINEAQQVLLDKRRQPIRFIIICQTRVNILKSIVNACRVINFEPISNKDVLNVILNVCEREKLPNDSGGLKELAFRAQGDLRVAVNNLQILANSNCTVSAENVKVKCPDSVKIPSLHPPYDRYTVSFFMNIL